MEKKSVQVFCMNENAQIGVVELSAGKITLTPTIFLGSFVPRGADYMFSRDVSLKSGTIVHCPKCGGNLAFEKNGHGEDEKLKKAREAARNRAAAIAQSMTTGPMDQRLVSPVGRVLTANSSENGFAEIVLGKTKLMIE